MYYILSKPGCSFCESAKTALRSEGLAYDTATCVNIAEAKAVLGVRWGLDTPQTTFPIVVYAPDNERPTIVGGYVDLLDHLEEPVLRPDPARHTLYPIRHPKLFDLYKRGVASFWTPEEVSLKVDVDHWRKLSDDERYFVSRVLAFFAGSDGIVQENLAAMFCCETQWAEARQFYAMQIFQEAVHSEQYSLLIDTLIDDPQERQTLFEATQKIACVAKKADWAKKWITKTRRFAQRLVAFVCVEGILFSGSFCAIFWLKQRGLMPGLTLSNEWISRDEGLHYSFGCELYRSLVRKLTTDEVQDIIREAVDCELDFICEAIPCSMIGMNAANMTEYIKFVADRAAVDLGHPRIYDAVNPFQFMELQSLGGITKSNFFERTASEYQRAGVMSSSEDREFGLAEDF